MSVGTEKTVIHIIIQLAFQEGTAPDMPAPYEDWITYKTAIEESIESGEEIGFEALIFAVNPFREYEVRNNLPEGILSRNEHKGKIPFDELLKRATKSNQRFTSG